MGIHGAELLNQQVLLLDITLPEFTATQVVPRPIHATIYDNPDSVYDVILRMDIMQVLGIKIDCDSKIITWNKNTIPFYPADYFTKMVFSTSLFKSDNDPSYEDYAKEAGY